MTCILDPLHNVRRHAEVLLSRGIRQDWISYGGLVALTGVIVFFVFIFLNHTWKLTLR